MPTNLANKFKKRYLFYLTMGFIFSLGLALGLYSGVIFSSFASTTSGPASETAAVPAFTMGIGLIALGTLIKLKGRINHE